MEKYRLPLEEFRIESTEVAVLEGVEGHRILSVCDLESGYLREEFFEHTKVRKIAKTGAIVGVVAIGAYYLSAWPILSYFHSLPPRGLVELIIGAGGLIFGAMGKEAAEREKFEVELISHKFRGERES